MTKMSKGRFWAWIVVLSIAGLLVRLIGINYEGVDLGGPLTAWFNQMIASGRGLQALRDYRGDYNMPYITMLLGLTYLPIDRMYSIKASSIIFDYLAAGVLAGFMKEEESDRAAILAYAFVLFNPLVFMNSGFLGQCDCIYASLCALSFVEILKDRPVRSMLALGAAMAIKLQTIFYLPVLAFIYFRKKNFSVLHLLIVPAVVELMCVPAIIAGRGWDIAVRAYIAQASLYQNMYYYYPNLWALFQKAPYYYFGRFGVAVSFLFLLAVMIICLRTERELSAMDYLDLFIYTSMICAVILPCMHERYNFLAEVLLPIRAINKRSYRIPAILLVASAIGCYLASYFYNTEGFSPYLMAVVNLAILVYLSADLLPPLFKAVRGKEAA